MQNQFGQAGKSTRERGEQLRKNAILFTIVIGVAALAIMFVFLESITALLGGVGLLIFLGIIVFVIFNFTKRSSKKKVGLIENYMQGAVGEEKIGELLAQLEPDQYVVLHDWRSPYGNIDHIVHDSKGNIFMIETKSHYGNVKVQGESLLRGGRSFEKNFIKQSLNNSYWMKNTIEQKLGVTAWITPVIVFTNAFVEFGRPIKKVYYMNKKYLLKFIREHKGSSPAGLKLGEMRKRT